MKSSLQPAAAASTKRAYSYVVYGHSASASQETSEVDEDSLETELRQTLAERDWNEEFQTALAMKDSPEKYRTISQLANDFVYAAKL
jgi:ABC-type phosphate transport system auxiliary subunit